MRRQVATAAWIVLILSAMVLPSMSAAQSINACVGKNGSVRIVTDGSACRYPDVPLAWNVGFRVYDAAGVEVGPLSGVNVVTFSVNGKRYSAPVGPNGWVASQSTFYFFDDQCSGRPYLLRSMSSDPSLPEPPAPPVYFFTTLQVIGGLGYYQDGTHVKKTLTYGNVEVWRWDQITSSCLDYDVEGTFWFGSMTAISLPAHQPPFTLQ